jgi:hypothetical protein
MRVLRRRQKFPAPLSKDTFDLILILFGNELVETRGNFPEHRFNSPLHAIFRMKLQLTNSRRPPTHKKRRKRAKRQSRRMEGQRRSLAILEKLASAKNRGTAFLPQPAQTEAPGNRKQNGQCSIGFREASRLRRPMHHFRAS